MTTIRIESVTVDFDLRELRLDDRVVPLREKEARLLSRLHDDIGEVVERDTLYQDVFGYIEGARSRTLDSTVQRLRRKLGDLGVTERIQTVYGQGYRLTRGASSDEPTPLRAGLIQELRQGIERASTVVVLGPAGIGKTTLVREALAGRSGVVWVELQDGRLLSSVAGSLGLASTPTLEGLGAALHDQGALLVIDNAELARESARNLTELPVPVLFLSRVRLPLLDDPHVLLVPPLDPEETRRLFEAQGSPVEPGLMSELIGLLDGNPLSIRYAARRARLLGAEALCAELRECMDLLRGSEEVPPRQRSLRAMIDTTLAVLDSVEREILHSLSLFRRPFSLTEVRRLLGSERIESFEGLIEAGLIHRAGARFTLHARLVERLAQQQTLGADQIEAWCGLVIDQCRAVLPEVRLLPSSEVLGDAAQRIALDHPGRFELAYARVLRTRAMRHGLSGDASWLRKLAPPETGRDQLLHALSVAEVAMAAHPPEPTCVDEAVSMGTGFGPEWGCHALHKRARLQGVLRNTEALKRDLFAMEAAAAEQGERALHQAWLDAAGLFADAALPDECIRRLRRVEGFLETLPGDQQVRWHRIWIAVTFEAMDYRASKSWSLRMLEATEQHGAIGQKAFALALLAASESELGEHQRALESGMEASKVAVVDSQRMMVISWMNLAVNHWYRLDFPESLRCGTKALSIAGTQPRLRSLATSKLMTLERVMGFAGSEPDPHLPGYLGQGDHEHFLWWAQRGDPDRAVALAEQSALVDGVEPAALFHRIALAEVYLSMGRRDEARRHLEEVGRVFVSDQVWSAPFAAACRVVGLPMPREPARTPYHDFVAGCWEVVADRERHPQRAAERLAKLEAVHRALALGKYGELSWRLSVARELGSV